MKMKPNEKEQLKQLIARAKVAAGACIVLTERQGSYVVRPDEYGVFIRDFEATKVLRNSVKEITP